MKIAGDKQGEFDFEAGPKRDTRASGAGLIRLAATDLSNHLACAHVTTLDLSVLRGEREAPKWEAPDLAVIQELGLRHEAAYLSSLDDGKGSLVDLRNFHEQRAVDETLAAMKRGVRAIAQGSLALGRWIGRPDVMRRVERVSPVLGSWSYEVFDCKLARETKAATILQLALYSDLLGEIQGAAPEMMHVVVPGRNFEPESYRLAEYAAYYRHVRKRLERVSDGEAGSVDGGKETYPEPCAHCDVCRWFRECDARRREDDHLSLVAGMRRLQQKQLDMWSVKTVAKLAEMPLPIAKKPAHGSRESYVRVREQARVQVEGRTRKEPFHELLEPAADMGFARLPEPARGDVFVDLEGDRFAGEHGQEYLFGFVARGEDGTWKYEKKWAFNADEEKRGFEWLVDEIMRRWAADAKMHVYHFGAYEPSALKRLMGIYTTREDEIDRMLRAHLLVDLHTVVKQAVRASVEEYSLKKLEAFYGFARGTAMEASKAAMRYVEHRLELGWEGELPEGMREAMEGYNRDDCRSAGEMRKWLEGERAKKVEAGAKIERPEIREGAPSEELDEKQKRVAELVAKLTADVPADEKQRTPEQGARWMLAQLLDWHRRENKAGWWEGYRLADLDDEELMNERAGLAGLQHVQRLGVERKIATDRYVFEKQETQVRAGDEVYRREKSGASGNEKKEEKDGQKRSEGVGEKIGTVTAIDLANRTVDIKKTRKTADVDPTAVFAWDGPIGTNTQADALFRIGEWVAQHGVDAPGEHRAGRDLLLRKPPRLLGNETLAPKPLEDTAATACRVGLALDESVLAIQGPPGAGKTYTAGHMICRFVQAGKKVGVTALSHNVIQKVLKQVFDAADETKTQSPRCLQKLGKGDEVEPDDRISVTTDNDKALEALRSGSIDVVGGTSFMWTREEFAGAVHTLFTDEAGQLALADVVAASQAAENLVLIGDPQQLDKPLKGSHPPGAEKSALEHLLGNNKTIPSGMGILLPETRRMSPDVCAFTSELFYEGKLHSHTVARNRKLDGHPWLSGSGLSYVPVEHHGNSNSSSEEVDVVVNIVKSFFEADVRWFYGIGNSRPLKIDGEEDLLIVAPYNAQVGDIKARLPKARVGTVDKFQGQQAAVVIYSMTTSSPEDAPRGMEFLYSLNRLNVATSRAMTNVIVVGSPRLFEPECRNPRQMQLANALCRYLELAKTVAI
jgi:predicted RecB family nuclease